jgi:hypothetical protein
MKNVIRITCAVTMVFCFYAQLSLADNSIGFIKKLNGSATVLRGKIALAVKPGDFVYMNDIIRTDGSGSVGITFKDNAMISIGPNTVYAIDEYVYQPKDNQLSFVSKISKGTLNFVSGNLTKLAPNAVKVNTPVGTMGMRGTHFLLKVEED